MSSLWDTNFTKREEKILSYECKVCDFWTILHGNEGNLDYKDERFKKCQSCTRIQRVEAYKDFWNKRTKEG